MDQGDTGQCRREANSSGFFPLHGAKIPGQPGELFNTGGDLPARESKLSSGRTRPQSFQTDCMNRSRMILSAATPDFGEQRVEDDGGNSSWSSRKYRIDPAGAGTTPTETGIALTNPLITLNRTL